MVKLSVTSKLDGIKSWSLQAITTCPGSADGKGGLVSACSGCYATDHNYRFKSVKQVRSYNQIDWKRPEFVSEFVAALKNESFFRWFDSGDLYDVKLAKVLYEIMSLTPHVKHWLPTRMYKFKKFMPVLNAMKELSNVMVRFSSDDIDGSYNSDIHGSCIIPESDFITNATICKAYDFNGKCNGCRACYDKNVKVIAYPAHGRKMKKIIKINAIK